VKVLGGWEELSLKVRQALISQPMSLTAYDRQQSRQATTIQVGKYVGLLFANHIAADTIVQVALRLPRQKRTP